MHLQVHWVNAKIYMYTHACMACRESNNSAWPKRQSLFVHERTNIVCYHTVWYYCVYRDSPLKTIYKDFVHFHFQFEVDFTFNDIKVKNMCKITSILKLVVL